MDSITAEEWETGYGPLSTTPKMMSEPSHVNGKAPSVPADKSAKGEIEDDSDDEEPESCGECSASRQKKKKFKKFDEFFENNLTTKAQKSEAFILYLVYCIKIALENAGYKKGDFYKDVTLEIPGLKKSRFLHAIKQCESLIPNTHTSSTYCGSKSIKKQSDKRFSKFDTTRGGETLVGRIINVNPELNRLLEKYFTSIGKDFGEFRGIFLPILAIEKSIEKPNVLVLQTSNTCPEVNFNDDESFLSLRNDKLSEKVREPLKSVPMAKSVSKSVVLEALEDEPYMNFDDKCKANQKAHEASILSNEFTTSGLVEYVSENPKKGLAGYLKMFFEVKILETITKTTQTCEFTGKTYDIDSTPGLFDKPFILAFPISMKDLNSVNKSHGKTANGWINRPSTLFDNWDEAYGDVLHELTQKYRVENADHIQLVVLKNKLKVEELFLTNDLAFVKKCTKK